MISLCLILNSLLCFGVRAACLPGNILYPLVYPIESWKERRMTDNIDWFTSVVHYLTKPIYLCTPCMASFWGFIFVSYLGVHLGFCNVLSEVGMATYILILCGLNFAMAKFLDK